VLDVFLARQIPLTFAQKATTPGLFSYVKSLVVIPGKPQLEQVGKLTDENMQISGHKV